MKKKIAIFLSLLTITICGWIIVDRLQYLDIPQNKNEWYAMNEKSKINTRTDIDQCEKNLLTNKIDQQRAIKVYVSGIAFQTQVIAFSIILIQIVLLIFIMLMPRKIKPAKLPRDLDIN